MGSKSPRDMGKSNSNSNNNSEDVYNFQKLRRVGHMLHEFLKRRTVEYQFKIREETEEAKKFVASLPLPPEDMLHTRNNGEGGSNVSVDDSETTRDENVNNVNNSKDIQGDVVLGGTFKDIVKWLAFLRHPSEYGNVICFLRVYRMYSDAKNMLEMIKELYESSWMWLSGELTLPTIKKRLVQFCTMWLDHCYEQDFNEELAQELSNFMQTLDGEVDTSFFKILEARVKQGKKKSKAADKLLGKTKEELLMAQNTTGASTRNIFSLLSPQQMAEQLTAIEWHLFSRIKVTEFHNQNWQRKNKMELAPNLTMLAARFNKVSFWVAGQVLMGKSHNERADRIKYWIQVAEAMFQHNDFNCLMEIVSGLNHSSISRLKIAWELVGSKIRERFERLDKVMDPRQNFKGYRDVLPGRKGAVFPYVAVYLRDMTFANDGNPDYLDNESSDDGNGDKDNIQKKKNMRLINFEKVQLLGHLVHDVLQYQNHEPSYNFNIRADTLVELQFISAMDDDELHNLSVSCEPLRSNIA